MPDRHNPSDLDRVLSGEVPDEAARLREMWQLVGEEPSSAFPDPVQLDRVWRTLDAASQEPRSTSPHVDRPEAQKMRRVILRPWMGVAATVLLVAFLGVAWWFVPVVEKAGPGERLAVTLPDGSQVELNSGTSLRYARRFGQERVVRLEGEAFFDVAHGERPFLVQTFNAQVTVLGTRFNVRAWPRSIDPNTTVSLEEGRVALAPIDQAEQLVTLSPGQSHRITKDGGAPSLPDSGAVAMATAWRTGDLVFKDQQLGIILEDVERRFGVDITLKPSSLRETATFIVLRNPTHAEHVIRDLCLYLNLNYRETSTGYEIYAPASQ